METYFVEKIGRVWHVFCRDEIDPRQSTGVAQGAVEGTMRLIARLLNDHKERTNK